MQISKKKRWQLLFPKKETKKEEILKVLLSNRGLKSQKEIQTFFSPPDPYFFSLSDLGLDEKQFKLGLERIKKAVVKGEKIIVYGDFDADGICASAVLWETLHGLGGKALPFIPQRAEGFGLKVDRLDQFKKEGVSLIVTVDHGVVAYQQAQHAKKIGIDLIITDHHAPGKKKPRSYATIHTRKVCAAALAWFLSLSLAKKFPEKKVHPGLELATIATVTDLMPLTGVNRALVKSGLLEVRKTKRIGLLGLYQAAGIDKEKIDTFEIGFIIGPRINVSGRIDDPMEALRLLCTKDEKRAFLLASKLNDQNRERRDLTDQAYFFARQLWLEKGKNEQLIFLSHESFDEGIVGLVAGKLTEEFGRPSIVVSTKGEMAKASARSITQFDIIEAIQSCEDLLEASGGHPMAAGFSLKKEKIETLRIRLTDFATEKLTDVDLSPLVKIDLEIDLSAIDMSLFNEIQKFAPFGLDNYQPVFLIQGLILKEVRTVGQENQHLKLVVIDPQTKKTYNGIGFGLGSYGPSLNLSGTVDLAYTLSLNEWNGNRQVELKIKDVKSDGKGI